MIVILNEPNHCDVVKILVWFIISIETNCYHGTKIIVQFQQNRIHDSNHLQFLVPNCVLDALRMLSEEETFLS